MRLLGPFENALRETEYRAMAAAIRRRVGRKCVDADTLVAQVANGVLHAWEHEGTVVLVHLDFEGGTSVARVAYATGDMGGIVRWYAAWEAMCREFGVQEIRIAGRKGWLRVARRYGFGFVRDPRDGIVNRIR